MKQANHPLQSTTQPQQTQMQAIATPMHPQQVTINSLAMTMHAPQVTLNSNEMKMRTRVTKLWAHVMPTPLFIVQKPKRVLQ
jgi:hypothetical protein